MPGVTPGTCCTVLLWLGDTLLSLAMATKDTACDLDSDGDGDFDFVADSSQTGDREPSVALGAFAGEAPTQRWNGTVSPDRDACAKKKSVSAAADEHEHEHHGQDGYVRAQVRHLPASTVPG